METELIIEHGIPITPLQSTGGRPKPEGSCSRCSRIPRPGHKICDYHLNIARRKAAARRAEGKCASPGCKNLPKVGRTMCADHLQSLLDYVNQRRRSRVKASVCIDCGKLPPFWGLRCVICRQQDTDDPLPPGARLALATYRRQENINARREQARTAIEWTSNERTAKIFTMRHGLDDGVDRTLEEVGAKFLITRERVRQIESKHLRWLASEGFDVSLLRPPFKKTSRKPFDTRRHLVSEEKRKQTTAHGLVARALESGELIKGTCGFVTPDGKCGALDTIGHHPDYDKPLEVQWLCRKHHMETHRKMRAGAMENQQ